MMTIRSQWEINLEWKRKTLLNPNRLAHLPGRNGAALKDFLQLG
jgi:hypothetical protein